MIGTNSLLAAALLFGQILAQDPAATTDSAPAASPAAQDAATAKLQWPRDRERVVCRVGGVDHTLEALLAHIAERHYPGMLALVDGPTGKGYFEHPVMASWVRQYADVVALEAVALRRGITYADAREELGNALRRAFEAHLEDYSARREREGRPIELTQERVDLLLTDFQRDHGLGVEVQGWLNVLVPAIPLDQTQRIRDFYADHPTWFGGVVTVAQILVQHRDPVTLELKTGAAREAAFARLADVRRRLKPDGSNFEEVARLLSEDRRTAREGGRLSGIERFDERLPAAICRAAWSLKDGEVSEPFESPFGIHLVKRVEYKHLYYVIFNDRIAAEVADTMQRAAQEDLLFETRANAPIVLRY